MAVALGWSQRKHLGMHTSGMKRQFDSKEVQIAGGEEVRRHFNCSRLEGAEMEDQGEDGTRLTHWEKRIFENEAMTGTHTQNPVYSRITLALMEDTGRYDAGCVVTLVFCSALNRNMTIHPFCDKVKKDPLETECTESRDSVALCNLVDHGEDLDQMFQNFDYIPGVPSAELGRFGGSVILADFCPYIQEFTWKSKNTVVRGSQCQFEENNPQEEKNFALEYYGPGSKCFNHNREMWVERTCSQVRTWQHWGSGCYKYSCSEGRLHIEVANHTYTCYHSKQQIRIQLFASGWLHIGTIVCPTCRDICQKEGMECDADLVKASYVLAEKQFHKDMLHCQRCPVQCQCHCVGLCALSVGGV
ncbi:hypothetical protein HPB48_023850 [Haemaphysalis longicornis]|uniref:Leishmanolysin-like peptidase n=1 Tax=Haemaphysalis longicornis TaxID=44386 RepID=A0A9J6H634_HAELO|nr:hypothetical protein HPB48_023850 [Haemaphysalis longicornis]